MARKINITSALATKQSELLDTAADAKGQAEYLRSQISGYEATANLSTKQAAAVDEALAILNAAGVSF